MGNQIATPGKTTATQRDPHSAGAPQGATVGKTTLVDQQYGHGNQLDPAMAQGANAQTAGSDESYPPGYREKLERVRADRVNQAYTNAQRALGDLRVDTLLTRVDEVPWWANLIMGLVLTQLGNAISAGIGALRRATNIPQAIKLAVPEFEGSISEAIGAANESAARWAKKEAWLAATKEFRGLAAKHVEDITKKMVDGMTRPMTTANVASSFNQDSDAQRDKSSAINYLDMLSDQIGFSFEVIREQAPQHMTIAELTADTQAWAQKDHTVSHYHAAFHEMVTKYVNSNASKIGRDQKWDTGAGKHVEREVRVAWLVTKGAGKKLVYMDRVFDDWYQSRSELSKSLVDIQRSGAYDNGENQLSLEQAATWTVNGHEKQHREIPLRDDKVLNYVEPEFQELALEKSKRTWMVGPAVFEQDWDHQVAPGVPAIVKVAGS